MASGSDTRAAMPVVAALQVLIAVRKEGQVVVTNQGSARVWPKLNQNPLDLHYNPSTMGGAIPLGLGIALAQPQREVLVVSGDGSLLMSLGSLLTVVGSGSTNLTIVVLDNAMYEVTGGQKTAASNSPLDLCGIARAAGFPTVAEFTTLSDWQTQAARVLSQTGPRFIRLAVQSTPKEYLLGATPPMAEQLTRLKLAFGTSHQDRSQGD